MSTSQSTSSGSRRLLLGAAALALLSATALASPLDWISGNRVKGDGAVNKQTRNVGQFTALALNLPGSVELRIGDSDSVSVETDGNLQPLIETTVEDGTLTIQAKKRRATLTPTTLKFIVQARSIERISVGGSGTVYAPELNGPELQFKVGGSGSIHVKRLRSENVEVKIGGSGNFTGAGSTDRYSASIGGSGNVQSAQLNANKVQVNIGGSGHATVWAKQSLGANIGGSGNIDYYGDPEVSRNVAGSGKIRRIDAAPH
ncbi:head GIN domain-containing protein [Janthinobacterium fluminis]|uniref:DUF2807 domain-containing protein n=1 Tax=Janthinobacterium fluminis TaxID=2987524 RepID=A0ABT5K5R5_9BURK|nr:head GIN domain-containing protein [Janthinobacterium fluminis]MDC8760131.1 DUF2807 domain-containing protein [Janthinobacterium fluminis]